MFVDRSPGSRKYIESQGREAGPGAKEMRAMKFPSATSIERLPWAVRALLGCCTASLSELLNYGVMPLRPFPLMLAFPTVILSCWFLGMWGGIVCALTEAVLVDIFFTQPTLRFTVGSAPQELRFIVFLTVTIALGWAIRRLSQQRAELRTQELQQRLGMANADRMLAEERARASEALRDRDELLQIALRANGMGLWVWDLIADTIHRSDEMYRMVGREPGSFPDAPGAWLKFVRPEDRDGLVEAIERSRHTGVDYHHEYRVVWPDGSVHWLESQGKCQRDGEGRLTRLVGVMADITHRKLAEEAMLRAEKLAVAGRLAASVAHEINNPLEAVANLLFLITLADSAEAAREHAQQGIDQVMRISQITQQTLKFHRQTGAPKIIRLSEILEAVLDLFRGKLHSAGISVETRIEREEAVACMPSETQQIFANLVTNAIDAVPRGGRLVVRLRPSRDWRGRAADGMRVTFCDSGQGMDRRIMRRIFEPFFTTKTEIGTGLGMWVVAQLVERHHGCVHVWSTQRPGASGTAFSVFLPFAGAPAAVPAASGREDAREQALTRG
jgi:signal transduction histidine kinase